MIKNMKNTNTAAYAPADKKNYKSYYYSPVSFAGDPVETFIDKKSFQMFCVRIRNERHLTQKELAQMSGLSVSCISDIEGGGNPTLNSIVKYLNCLGYRLEVG